MHHGQHNNHGSAFSSIARIGDYDAVRMSSDPENPTTSVTIKNGRIVKVRGGRRKHMERRSFH